MSNVPVGFNQDGGNSAAGLYRSIIIPNRHGTFALYHEWPYHSARHSSITSYYLLDIATGSSSLLPKSTSFLPPGSALTNFIWVYSPSDILCQAQVNGKTHLISFNIVDKEWRSQGLMPSLITICKAVVTTGRSQARITLVIAQSLKIIQTPSACSRGTEHDFLGFTSTLSISSEVILSVLQFQTIGSLTQLMLTSFDILESTGLEFVPFPVQLPMEPMNFDISSAGLVFVAKYKGEGQYQNHHTSDIFFIPIDLLLASDKPTDNFARKIPTEFDSGSASMPIFNPGKAKGIIAFLKRDNNAENKENETSIFRAVIDETHDLSVTRYVSRLGGSGGPFFNPEVIAWSGTKRNVAKIVDISRFDIGKGWILGAHHFPPIPGEANTRTLITHPFFGVGSSCFTIYSHVSESSLNGEKTAMNSIDEQS
ncbi:hypothetical protein EYC80_006474 [Monilinia laxa]|uniref:Uncharacterized protein n=1 Tax=Monilinia laxa TaxID=61186 RepID=A0A5N6JUV5_MONLA|nr:hypothetical protein EYC80_006474 [Monilinia laxa]